MKFPVALQLYSVRRELAKDTLGTLEAVKKMGYDGVELVYPFPVPAKEYAKMLSDTGLEAVSAHVALSDMLSDTDKIIGELKEVGCRYAAVPYLTEEDRPGKPGFGSVIESVAGLVSRFAGAGITLMYHNHDFEFVRVGGKYGLDILLDSVPGLCCELDTCWAKAAGVNPGKFLRRRRGRAPVVHLKDFVMQGHPNTSNVYKLIGIDGGGDAKADENGDAFAFRSVGHGCQDVEALLCAARQAKSEWIVVEQDEPTAGKTPLECAKESMEYLSTVNPQRRLRIGIVGAGNIANNAHLPAYAKIDNAHVVAVADICAERAEETARKYGIPEWYTSVEQMCEEAEIDAVDICTWNSGHAPVAIAAAKAGKDILCEKPMTTSVANAVKMAKAVKENGVGFMLAVPGRFGAANEYIRGLMERGELGDVYYGKTAYIRRRGTPFGWFTDLKHSGGGPVIDIGIHGIDAAWYLMGNPKPTRVSAQVNTQIGDYQTKGVGRWHGTPCPDNQFDVEDSGMGVIHFENGAMLVFEASWAINAPDGSSTLVCGSKAGATVSPLTVYGERDGYLSTDTITVQERDRFAEEISHFADKMMNGGEVRYPLEQAVQMQQILEAIYRSGKEGKEITIK